MRHAAARTRAPPPARSASRPPGRLTREVSTVLHFPSRLCGHATYIRFKLVLFPVRCGAARDVIVFPEDHFTKKRTDRSRAGDRDGINVVARGRVYLAAAGAEP